MMRVKLRPVHSNQFGKGRIANLTTSARGHFHQKWHRAEVSSISKEYPFTPVVKQRNRFEAFPSIPVFDDSVVVVHECSGCGASKWKQANVDPHVAVAIACLVANTKFKIREDNHRDICGDFIQSAAKFKDTGLEEHRRKAEVAFRKVSSQFPLHCTIEDFQISFVSGFERTTLCLTHENKDLGQNVSIFAHHLEDAIRLILKICNPRPFAV